MLDAHRIPAARRISRGSIVILPDGEVGEVTHLPSATTAVVHQRQRLLGSGQWLYRLDQLRPAMPAQAMPSASRARTELLPAAPDRLPGPTRPEWPAQRPDCELTLEFVLDCAAAGLRDPRALCEHPDVVQAICGRLEELETGRQVELEAARAGRDEALATMHARERASAATIAELRAQLASVSRRLDETSRRLVDDSVARASALIRGLGGEDIDTVVVDVGGRP
jgi:hypothetical protein